MRERQPVRRVTWTRASAPVWPRAAVFDCDGLLIDSAACWERAYTTVAAQHGRTLTSLDLTALAGASVARAAAQLSRALDLHVDEADLRCALRDAVTALSPQPMLGAHRLVAALAPHMALAVATNGPRDIVCRMLEGVRIDHAFSTVVSAEETPADKPAPDVYLEACRRLGVAASDAIALEDSPLGAQAARAAGLVVIAVPFARGLAIDADLIVPRLSDPRLYEYLGLVAAHPTMRVGRP
jgi:HAD superfamily hydrolase (TIGR01509 family)